jgi:hypothetical protein
LCCNKRISGEVPLVEDNDARCKLQIHYFGLKGKEGIVLMRPIFNVPRGKLFFREKGWPFYPALVFSNFLWKSR